LYPASPAVHAWRGSQEWSSRWYVSIGSAVPRCVMACGNIFLSAGVSIVFQQDSSSKATDGYSALVSKMTDALGNERQGFRNCSIADWCFRPRATTARRWAPVRGGFICPAPRRWPEIDRFSLVLGFSSAGANKGMIRSETAHAIKHLTFYEIFQGGFGSTVPDCGGQPFPGW